MCEVGHFDLISLFHTDVNEIVIKKTTNNVKHQYINTCLRNNRHILPVIKSSLDKNVQASEFELVQIRFCILLYLLKYTELPLSQKIPDQSLLLVGVLHETCVYTLLNPHLCWKAYIFWISFEILFTISAFALASNWSISCIIFRWLTCC